jgi:hypothetical protein
MLRSAIVPVERWALAQKMSQWVVLLGVEEKL